MERTLHNQLDIHSVAPIIRIIMYLNRERVFPINEMPVTTDTKTDVLLCRSEPMKPSKTINRSAAMMSIDYLSEIKTHIILQLLAGDKVID